MPKIAVSRFWWKHCRHSQSDVIHTLDEAVDHLRSAKSIAPAVATMFDSHNAEDETEPHDQLIRRHYDLIRHIHLNEMDGSHPGSGKRTISRRCFAMLEKAVLSTAGYPWKRSISRLGPRRSSESSLEHMKKAATGTFRSNHEQFSSDRRGRIYRFRAGPATWLRRRVRAAWRLSIAC